MPIILSLGSNLGDRAKNLNTTITELKKILALEYQSRVFHSPAVDYINQPSFYNQLLQFKTPTLDPVSLLKLLKKLEIQLGRTKSVNKGPRLIDIDIIFFNFLLFQNTLLTIPHPSAILRSFIIEPLRELPFYTAIEKNFYIPTTFSNSCQALLD